ncbi:MAG: hypothetical protein HC817_15835 [Saprospiraceae bacterium]|nr:hypothetical protein [Saprospiraceae bacterium]
MRAYEFIFEYFDVQKTKQNFGDKLLLRAKTDDSVANLSVDDILQQIIDVDPTGKKGTYAQWVIKNYLNKNIMNLTDLSSVKNLLTLFDKFKNKLPIEQRDINKIHNLSSLATVVSQFKDQKTG